ncbi:hypothetical protein [Rhodovulum sp. MB263]|uniref:hypothetical protein n=1 Tax=Rhodovulum sp. (strain MB263) TaxID=308754 RepID=UPI001E2F9F73|nr:hypothetical protein [Rhodovulum sp. MB263]
MREHAADPGRQQGIEGFIDLVDIFSARGNGGGGFGGIAPERADIAAVLFTKVMQASKTRRFSASEA